MGTEPFFGESAVFHPSDVSLLQESGRGLGSLEEVFVKHFTLPALTIFLRLHKCKTWIVPVVSSGSFPVY